MTAAGKFNNEDNKHVDVGYEGSTPVQVFRYNVQEPIADVQKFDIGGQPSKSVQELQKEFSSYLEIMQTCKEVTDKSLERPKSSYRKTRKLTNGEKNGDQVNGRRFSPVKHTEGAEIPRGRPAGDELVGSANSQRPKTSRGKPHPSPDDFFDYVVPSPNGHNVLLTIDI